MSASIVCVNIKICFYFSSGGIEAFTGDGKIRVVNTLEARLNMLFAQMVPEIRVKLFGKNVNRVHDN